MDIIRPPCLHAGNIHPLRSSDLIRLPRVNESYVVQYFIRSPPGRLSTGGPSVMPFLG